MCELANFKKRLLSMDLFHRKLFPALAQFSGGCVSLDAHQGIY